MTIDRRPLSGSHLNAVPANEIAAGEAMLEGVVDRFWYDDDAHKSQTEAARTMATHAGMAAGLKPFPATAHRILSLLSDPNTTVRTIREAIETSPALASRLLRVANSAAYRPARPCGSIDEALVRLGNGAVRDLVASIAVLGLFHDMGGIGLAFRDHCTAVAAIARVLSAEWGKASVGSAFICGLLHDVGKLLSIQVGEIAYDTFPAEALCNPDRLHIEERARTGYDHAVLGAHVLNRWQLPVDIVQVVAWHHQPARAFAEGDKIGITVAFVRLANQIDYALRDPKNAENDAIAKIAEDSAAQYLGIDEATLRAGWSEYAAAVAEISAILG